MSKKNIVILIFILLILGLIWFIYILFAGFFNSQQQANNKGIGSLFPFTSTTVSSSTNIKKIQNTQSTQEQQATSTQIVLKYDPLIQISKRLVAGLIVIKPTIIIPKNTPKTKTVPKVTVSASSTNASSTQILPILDPLPTVRFAERGTGFIFDVNARAQNEKQITNNFIVRSVEAYFADNGNTLAIRLIKEDNKTIATYFGHIPVASTTQASSTNDFPVVQMKGEFLTDNIEDLTVSNDGKNIFYFAPSDTGLSGLTMNSNGANTTQILSTAFTEWLSQWTADGISITTKAGSDIPGFSYFISNTGVYSKIIGDKNGLTTNLSPDGKNVLFGVDENNSMTLGVKTLASNTEKSISLGTLPEKCVWSNNNVTVYCGVPITPPANRYPDDWYKGIVHFTDEIWKIDTSTGLTEKINNGEGNVLDITNMALDSKERFLVFINKNDHTSWSLDLHPELAPLTTTN